MASPPLPVATSASNATGGRRRARFPTCTRTSTPSSSWGALAVRCPCTSCGPAGVSLCAFCLLPPLPFFSRYPFCPLVTSQCLKPNSLTRHMFFVARRSCRKRCAIRPKAGGLLPLRASRAGIWYVPMRAPCFSTLCTLRFLLCSFPLLLLFLLLPSPSHRFFPSTAFSLPSNPMIYPLFLCLESLGT